jgi:hypothetical protein
MTAEVIFENCSAIEGNGRAAVKKRFLRRLQFDSDERFAAEPVIIEVALVFMGKAIRRFRFCRHRAGERFFGNS